MASSNRVILIKGGSESIFRGTVKQRYKIPALGLLSLASFLGAHGYDVKVVDLLLEDYGPVSLATALGQEVPLAVGISVYTDTAAASLEIAEFVKTVFPETTVVVGGPHPTFCVDEMFACPAVDFVVRGEGESTLIELLEALKWRAFPLDAIAGLSYRLADGSIRHTIDRGYLQALDILPFPMYDVDAKAEGSVFYAVSSRGCPARCMFCASRAYSGSAYRMHSAEWLFSLVVSAHRRMPFRIMDILDDTFTANRTRTRRFCELLKASGLGLSIRVKSRVDYIRDDMVATLAGAGCVAVHIGVESADAGILAAIGKGITPDEIMRAVEILVAHGIRADTSLMLGHAFDTRETMEKTVILATVLKRVGTTAIGISTPYPGTRLHREAEALGLDIAVRNWRKYDTVTPIYSSPNFDLNDVRKAYYMFEAQRDHLRGAAILTGSRHDDYWAALDAWVARIEALKQAAALPPAAGTAA